MTCPKCKSENVVIQQVQSGSLGAAQNKVVIQKPKKSKGCLYWVTIGWFIAMMKFLLWDWWAKFLLGGRKKSGLNFSATKSFTKTMAVCQNCGNSWKV